MSNPYFIVGEPVILVSPNFPVFNGDYIVESIVDSDSYTLEGLKRDSEMIAVCGGLGFTGCVDQTSLRKKPKLSDDEFSEISFSELMTNYTAEPIE